MVGRIGAWGVPALTIVTVLAMNLSPGTTCTVTATPSAAPVIIRIDGTTLTEWNRSEPLRAALATSAAAAVLLPHTIADADRIELSGVPGWYDPGLGGRRVIAAAHAAWGTRSDLNELERGGGLPAQARTANTGTFVASSPDARPIIASGSVVSGSKPDANWPTGGRADLDAMREAITSIEGPVELDIGDIWRLEHERMPNAARGAFADDVLDNIVAPLIATASEAQRPVILISVIPSLTEQHAERWRGAIAILGGTRGLLSSDRMQGDDTERRDVGIATNRTLPGTIDVSRLLGATRFTTIPDRERTPTVDAPCLTSTPGDDVPGATRDRELGAAARVHDLAATLLLGLLTVAALLASWLIAAARRAVSVRSILSVIAASALLLPIAATLEGALAGSLAIRIALLVSVIAPAAALVAWLPTRAALGVAGLIGAIGGLIELSRGGADVAGSMLSAPLYRGIRTEGPDAFLVAMTVVAIAVAASWWADTAVPRLRRAIELMPLTIGAAILLWMRSGALPASILLLAIAGGIAFASLHERRAARIAALLALPVALFALMLWRSGFLPLAPDRFEDLVLLRAGAQPALWPMLALLTALLLVVRLRLSERHEDVLARASFGSPAWRTAEASLYAIAPIAAATMAAGTFGAALMTLLALLIGRIR